MATTIAQGVWLFVDDDDGFVRRCLKNPEGYVVNCGRTASGGITSLHMIHKATRKGDLCPHFKDKRTTTGYAANLTTTAYCKAFSTDRRALLAALGCRTVLRECSDCMRP